MVNITAVVRIILLDLSSTERTQKCFTSNQQAISIKKIFLFFLWHVWMIHMYVNELY